ncbi:MAG: FmdB family transcriptional regulator, partial [Bowdeniella nasicola]|nr:FmdB family transcriptional regulator [Bowdeniella nasicola]
FEVQQSIHDDSLKMCEGCGGRLRKLFSPAAVMFKGSGFYRTDNRTASTKTASTPKPKPAPAKKPASKSTDA